jgi:hypothetical protein
MRQQQPQACVEASLCGTCLLVTFTQGCLPSASDPCKTTLAIVLQFSPALPLMVSLPEGWLLQADDSLPAAVGDGPV